MAETVSMDHPSGNPGTQGSREVAAKAGAMERPEYYLELAEGSVEAVQKMSSSLKFNNEQCEYLADKLIVVVQSGSSFLRKVDKRFSCDDSTGLAEIFKLLVALGKQIESFVEGCGKDAWIQAAMTLTNVSQYVSSLGFNLELCRIAFCVDFGVSGCLLSSDEVADINKTEADIVEKKASADADLLLKKLTRALNSLHGEDRDLAGYLLQRLLRFDPNMTFENYGTFLSKLFALVEPAEQVGRGASATVYKAKWLGTRVAKKTFKGSENAEFDKEVKILSRLCHPNITSMFCCAKRRRNCSLIMELMDGDLDHLMERRCDGSADSDCAPFPILEAVDIMDQIGEGVKYLHSQGVVHRDLKSKNILYKKVKARNLDIGYVHVKVTDFGVSKTRDKSTTNSDLTFNVGTNRWMPPEVMKLAEMGSQRSWFPKTEKAPTYPFKVDTYSFGMVCYEILTGHRPFHGNQNEKDIKRRVMKDGERPKLPDDCPPKLKALIEKCWSQKPTERPTFAEICGELKYLKYLLISAGSWMHLDDDTGPSPKNLVMAVMGVKTAVTYFADTLITDMSKYPDELKHLKQRIRHEVQGDVDRAKHWKFLVQAFVCHRLFESFETETHFFGNGNFVGVKRSPLSSFSDFKKLEDISATISRLLAQKSADLSFLGLFCFKKFKSIVGGSTTNLPLARYEEEWSMVDEGRHPRTEFYLSFLKVAVSIWFLHQLVHSFEQKWSMLGWKTFPKGCKFKKKNMESVVPGGYEEEDEETGTDGNTVVDFLVIPGFQVSKWVVKCEVYRRSENSLKTVQLWRRNDGWWTNRTATRPRRTTRPL